MEKESYMPQSRGGSQTPMNWISKENEDLRNQLRDPSSFEKPGTTSQEALVTLQMLHAAQSAYAKLQSENQTLKNVSQEQANRIVNMQSELSDLRVKLMESNIPLNSTKDEKRVSEEDYRQVQDMLAKVQMEKAEIYNKFYQLQIDDNNVRALVQMLTLSIGTVRRAVQSDGFNVSVPENYTTLWSEEHAQPLLANLADLDRHKLFSDFYSELNAFVADSIHVTQTLSSKCATESSKSTIDQTTQDDFNALEMEKLQSQLNSFEKSSAAAQERNVSLEILLKESQAAIDRKTADVIAMSQRLSSLEAEVTRLLSEKKASDEKKGANQSFFEEYVELKREVTRLKAMLGEPKNRSRSRPTSELSDHKDEGIFPRSKSITPEGPVTFSTLGLDKPRISLPTPVGKMMHSAPKYPTLHVSEGLPLLPQVRK